MAKRDSWVMGMALAALAAVAAPAQASTELVINGGFEQQTFAGWLSGGDDVFNTVLCGAASGYAGDCSAVLGSGMDSSLAQTINVGAAGLTYNLSFAVQADGSTPTSFSVLFGGQTLTTLSSPAAGDYMLYNFSGTTTGENMTLAFSFASPAGGSLYLDAVSVTAVPEPATVGLMAAGLAGLLVARRRAGKAAAAA